MIEPIVKKKPPSPVTGNTTYFDVDVVGEVFEFVCSGQAAKFSVVVVRRESVVSASLYVDGSQVATERTAVPEQEVCDL